jgi:hypothetical protein
MPFAQRLIVDIPPVFLCTIIIFISVVFSVAGILITRCFLSHQKRKIHNDVAGPIFATVGGIYAVLLAFVVVIIWQAFDRAYINAEDEANCLGDLYSVSIAFPEGQRTRVRNLLEDYRNVVINEEWPLLGESKKSERVNEILSGIWRFYAGYEPENITEEIFLRESVSILNKLTDLRKMRIVDSSIGINRVLWFTLILGGVITIIFSFLFGTENHGVQMFMTVLLAVLIGLIIFTILQMDYPFSGHLGIKPFAFEHLASMH